MSRDHLPYAGDPVADHLAEAAAEPPAVDREALAHWLVGAGLVRGTGSLAAARAKVAQLIDDGILLDAATVRHEHGERIAKAQEVRLLHDPDCETCEDVREAIAIARELSPAPDGAIRDPLSRESQPWLTPK